MTSAPSTPRAKRLTEAEWAEAKALYETGKMTKTSLAEKFGISKQSLGEGLNARGAVYGSKSKEIELAAIEAQKTDSQRQVHEIQSFKEKQKKMVEMLQNLTIKSVTDTIKNSKPISDAKSNIATLRSAMAVIQAGRDELYHLYDLYRDPDADTETEEFIVSEYTLDEIEELNRERLGLSSDIDLGLAELAASLEDEDTGEIDAILGTSRGS